ncbi:hypothetical protein F0562_036165 [Nyssa sinensis]|uniref:Uncharacterized protein n=1 Tax=Nyssa sinensis TaxID=561372 RepID=A0A5J5AE04_9ASTE|nr:hypothetical protein F0562_036165 [Nyssa sinensis]
MAESLELPKATCPARSNSLPSTFHPLIVSVEDHLYRLKASEAKSSSICGNLSSLKDFLEHINDLVQLPRTQEPLSRERCDRWIEEVLDGSLVMLDACGTARDVLLLMKESVQELQSSLRRKRGTEFGLANEVSAYMISRKKINKMVSKRIENLKKFEKTRSLGHMDKDSKLLAIVRMFRELETISFSVLSCIGGSRLTLNQQAPGYLPL